MPGPGKLWRLSPQFMDSECMSSIRVRTPVRWLFVGCGSITKTHARYLREDARGRLVGCCDPDRTAAEKLARSFGPEVQYATTLEGLLDQAPADVVLVASPTHMHFDHTRQIRSSGLPVLCEKPLADSADRIRQLVAESQIGPLLSVAYQRRYSTSFRTLRRELASGQHGRLQSVCLQSTERWAQTITGTWRDDPARNPGGFLGDAGSHKLDALRFLTGLELIEVFARSFRRNWRVETCTQIAGLLTGGIPVAMSFVGDAQHYSERMWFHCEHADLMLLDGEVSIARNNRVEPLIPLEPESNPISAMIDCLLEQGGNLAPASIAWPIWQTTMAILESARTSQSVPVVLAG